MYIVFVVISDHTTQNILQKVYWILSARSVICKRLHRRIPCFQAKPKPMNPMMGTLPLARVVNIKAFAQVGVDFAGPFWGKGRFVTTNLSYKRLPVYICLHGNSSSSPRTCNDLTTCLFLSALIDSLVDVVSGSYISSETKLILS